MTHEAEKAGVITEDRGLAPGWESRNLGNLCSLISDGTHQTPKYVSMGVPFYSVENVTASNFTNTKFVSESAHKVMSSTRSLQKGDILMTRIGSLGRTKLIDWDVHASFYVSLAVLRPGQLIDPKYLYAFTQSSQFIRAVEGRSLLWAIPKKINMGDIGQIPIIFPSNPREQRLIAAAIDNAGSLVHLLERLIVKKQAIKQGIMQQLLTGKTRISGFSEPWVTTTLGEHFGITSSKRVFQKDWRSSGVPFYRARELAVMGARGRVDNELFIDRSLYNKYKNAYGVPTAGDFLVTGVGTLGRTYVVQPGDEFYFKDGNIIWFKSSETVDSNFLKFMFATPSIIKQIADGSSGTTVGTYTITNAKKTRILLPPIEEQRAIAKLLLAVTEEIDKLESRLLKARSIKRGMTQELLTGRTRLRHAGVTA
ncbi:restriction endonuclease subunit S [Glutamicibacter sp. AOP33-2CA-4]|uniref:restriction endonuclease subunit S n=1 Tax=Glutamicibacter sp. AOP33-2CA-4 TaxID=3457690 RepID=UPI004033384B